MIPGNSAVLDNNVARDVRIFYGVTQTYNLSFSSRLFPGPVRGMPGRPSCCALCYPWWSVSSECVSSGHPPHIFLCRWIQTWRVLPRHVCGGRTMGGASYDVLTWVKRIYIHDNIVYNLIAKSFQLVSNSVISLYFSMGLGVHWYRWGSVTSNLACKCKPHDDVFKWKHFPPYWPFVLGIQ